LFFFSVIKEHYQEFRNLAGAGEEFTDRGISVYGMVVSVGLLIDEHIGNEDIKKTVVPEILEYGIEILRNMFTARWEGNITSRAIELYNDQASYVTKKIQQYKSNYMHPPLSLRYQQHSNDTERAKKEGCYIATAVYGNYNHPRVIILRWFRDKTLNTTYFGKRLVVLYYKISPSIVRTCGSSNLFTKSVRWFLDRVTDYLDNSCSAR
ncbi:MAG: hypothetical protein PHP02_03050, partial [Eubacteriales bacterium]|nr:hypothetical protein [Eubacteriales bacterium]